MHLRRTLVWRRHRSNSEFSSIFDYEWERLKTISTSFQVGVAILLHWGSISMLVITCVIYVGMLLRHCLTDQEKRRRREYIQLKRDMARLNLANASGAGDLPTYNEDTAASRGGFSGGCAGFWMRRLRAALGVTDDPSFRVHLPVVLLAVRRCHTRAQHRTRLCVASTTFHSAHTCLTPRS